MLNCISPKSLDEIKILIDNHLSVNSIIGKNKIIIRKKELMILIRKNKNNYKIYSDLNFKNSLIIVSTIIAILLPITGLIFVFIILYSVKHKKLKQFRKEIYNIINV